MKPLFLKKIFAISILLSQLHVSAQHFTYQPGCPGNTRRVTTENMNISAWVQGGTTKHSRNSAGKKAELFDGYGISPLLYTFNEINLDSVTDEDTKDILNILVANTDTLMAGANNPETFGAFSLAGKFQVVSAGLNFGWNVTDHISTTVSVPMHHFKVKDTTLNPLTSAADLATNDGNDLNTFLQDKDTLLGYYGLKAGDVKDTTIGDIQMLTVATFHYEGSEVKHNACLSVATGFTIPTSRQKKIDEVFYVPMGNNGHVGLPIMARAKIELHKNMSLKACLGNETFLKRDTVRRIKTHKDQSNLFLLQQAGVRVKPGYKFDAGVGMCFHNDTKDRIFSVMYRYERQGKTTLKTLDPILYDNEIINTDGTLQKWHRHNLMLKASYTPSCCDSESYIPHMGVYFKTTVGGKRVFNTFLAGGCVGLDFSWNF